MTFFLSGFWGFLELIFFYLFWNAYLPVRNNWKHQCRACAIFWAAYFFVICFIGNEFLKITLNVVLSCILIFYLFCGPWYQHLLLIFLAFVINGGIDTLVLYGICTIMGISFEEFVWMKVLYVIAVTTSKLLSILLGWIIRKFRKSVEEKSIHRKWLLLTVLFPVVSLCMLIVIFYSFQDSEILSNVAAMFSILLTLANIAILYLIHTMEKNTAQMQEQALLRQQMQIQTDSIVALERSYRDQRQATHEFRNQLQTIHDLLQEDHDADAKAYIRQLLGTQTDRILTVNSRHAIVDAILNHKYQTAVRHGIDFQIQVNDLSGLAISTDELVVLLSNLLDNAIEACCRVKEQRTIQCSILMGDALFLSVRNTSLPVTVIGETIPTTKCPKEEHGFGLSRICMILKERHAEYTFAYQDGWFEFAAEIPIERS